MIVVELDGSTEFRFSVYVCACMLLSVGAGRRRGLVRLFWRTHRWYLCLPRPEYCRRRSVFALSPLYSRPGFYCSGYYYNPEPLLPRLSDSYWYYWRRRHHDITLAVILFAACRSRIRTRRSLSTAQETLRQWRLVN